MPAEELVWYLRLWRYPGLSTFWYALRDVVSRVMEEKLRPWLGEERGEVIGSGCVGESKAGSVRGVLTIAGQALEKVVAQRLGAEAN